MGSEETQSGHSQGMDAFRRAYLETTLRLAGWRAAQSCEAHVAHWVMEGLASHADLVESRDVTRQAHRAYTEARMRYNRLSPLAATRAGARAGGSGGSGDSVT